MWPLVGARTLPGSGVTYAMELHVEAAGIAHRLTLSIAAPQCGGGGLAVGTGEAHSAGGGLQQRRQTLQVQVKGLWLLLLLRRER